MLLGGGVLVLGGAGGVGKGVAAVACLTSGLCVAGVVIGVAVIGGVSYFAFRPRNDSDRRLIISDEPVSIRTADETAELGGFSDFSTGPLIELVYDGVALGSSPVPEWDEILATRYIDACQGFGGGAACVTQARDFISCVSYGGGSGSCADTKLLDGVVTVLMSSDEAADASASGDCAGTPVAPTDQADEALNRDRIADDARQVARTHRFHDGETSVNMTLICPEHLRGAWLEAFAGALLEQGLTLFAERWSFNRTSDAFKDFVERVAQSAVDAGSCEDGDFPVNVVDLEDKEGAEIVSTQRDATDRLGTFNIYAADNAVNGALVRHGNLQSTVTVQMSCL